jgi:hypothetical protein
MKRRSLKYHLWNNPYFQTKPLQLSLDLIFTQVHWKFREKKNILKNTIKMQSEKWKMENLIKTYNPVFSNQKVQGEKKRLGRKCILTFKKWNNQLECAFVLFKRKYPRARRVSNLKIFINSEIWIHGYLYWGEFMLIFIF